MDLSCLFAIAEDQDIVAVATTCCGLRLSRSGGRYQCLCPNPYHHDRHMGSFSINPHNKYWGCFACDLGQHRGNISLVSQLRGISKTEAAIEIGLTFGLISQSEAAEMLDKAASRHKAHQEPKIILPPPPRPRKREASHLDAVYRSFIQAAPPMDPAQRQELMETRCLSEADMPDFFSLPPKSQDFWAAFKQALKENGLTGTLNDILTGVPGFMRYAKSHRWSFIGKAGTLCLVSRNAQGQIIGFQLRTNAPGAKYVCFSSGSVSDNFDRCCSSGVMVGVEPPRNGSSCTIALTEGKFKAIALAKMNVWAVSISGVGGWEKAMPSIGDIQKAIAPKTPKFLVCFDADLKTNQGVAQYAKRLGQRLIAKYPASPVFYADWDLELGKGIDDVVNNGFAHRLRRVPAEEYLATTLA